MENFSRNKFFYHCANQTKYAVKTNSLVISEQFTLHPLNSRPCIQVIELFWNSKDQRRDTGNRKCQYYGPAISTISWTCSASRFTCAMPALTCSEFRNTSKPYLTLQLRIPVLQASHPRRNNQTVFFHRFVAELSPTNTYRKIIF